MSERKTLFDGWAASYDAGLENATEFPFEGYDRVLAEVALRAGMGDGANVLDVGTGTGALAADFRPLDLLGDWGDLEARRFDAVVSADVLHEFGPETKLTLLARFMTLLEPGGRVVIGDISFETVRARDAARRPWREVWDEDEHYWVARDAVSALQRAGLSVRYQQLSFCAGVYTLQAGA